MINVLIVDDSALVRSILRDFLEGSGKFRVAGEAENGREGVEKAGALNPDLVTMDIDMPVMNGFDAIEEIRKNLAVPVVVISTQDTARAAYEATVRGALEFYAKDLFTAAMTEEKRQRILDTLVHISGIKGKLPVLVGGRFSFGAAAPAARNPVRRGKTAALVIGVSTGGPRALCSIFGALPKDFPLPILLVQHNSSGFDKGFVQWLKDYTPLEVVLAQEGEQPSPGKIFMAPTDRHLLVGRDGAFTFDDGAPVNNQKPAADLLFKSAAKFYGAALISLVLTGMGCDGAEGTRAVKEAGGITLAQDEQSSMIYGMPRAAWETGCVDQVFSLDAIPQQLLLLSRN
ncbi:MAG: chemotaxis-specific protein-glutamate methyltransferase CheB [Treponema sp.]|jgi:two-component system chemotaxis response regulator CheB|nr:chemotaxis-specific protein-glutamate methyltransferase CheB [Treponema sp.]